MKLFNEIQWKALLYGVPIFLAPFVDKLGDILFNSAWPSPQQIVGCCLLGTIQASIGLKAFYDGSYQKAKDEKLEQQKIP